MTDIKRKAPIKSAEVYAVINSTAYIAKFTYVNSTDPILKIIVSDQVHTNQEEIIRQIDGAIGAFAERGTPVNFEQAKNHYSRDTRLVGLQHNIVDAKL
tara:strand:- start:81 stop:377 length:297 start_codon:yes stop_codon:yes gene_type:complete